MRNIGTFLILIGIGITMIFTPKTADNADEIIRSYTDAEFVQALVEAGYPVEDFRVFDETTDPNSLLGRPGGYIGKTSFEITNSTRYEGNMQFKASDPTTYIPENTIEMFDTPDDARWRADYIENLHRDNPIFGVQYIFLNDVFLLRLEQGVLPSEAVKYESALADAVAGQVIRPYQP